MDAQNFIFKSCAWDIWIWVCRRRNLVAYEKDMKVEIRRSTRADKKYMAVFPNERKVHFGARGYEDYTIHKDPQRKSSYIARHVPTEDWTKSGLYTAGFWSKHMLWNEPTLQKSASDLTSRYGLSVHLINVG